MPYFLNHSIYAWEGLSAEGLFLQGEIRSPNFYLAKAQLLSMDITIQKIRRKHFSFRVKKILAPQVRIQITEQLSDLISSGISMTRSLEAIEKIFPDPKVKTLFWLIKHHVHLGQSFGKTLQAFPRDFNLNYQALVQLGEASGQLEKTLYRLASLEKKKIVIATKIKKASFYPSLVLCLSLCVSGFLLIGIIPKFVEVFNHAHLALPTITLTLINLSKLLISDSGTICAVLCSALLILIYSFYTFPRIKNKCIQFCFSLPFLGKIVKAFYLNRINYGLSTLLQMGSTLTQALELLKKSIANPLYEEAIQKTLCFVEQGCSLSESLKLSALFPDFMIYSIKIGEESGLLAQSLLKAADFYESTIDQFVDNITLFLEPILMIILGFIVGIFLIALYLPIFSLGNIA